MKYYFIDYENVHATGFAGVEHLEENDSVCLMYTDHCKTMTLDVLEKITRRKAFLETYKAGTGSKNALDFQLSTYLGYIVKKYENQDVTFVIVSKDTGYDRVVEFWREKGMKIRRVENFEEEVSGKNESGDNSYSSRNRHKNRTRNNTRSRFSKQNSLESNLGEAESRDNQIIADIDNNIADKNEAAASDSFVNEVTPVITGTDDDNTKSEISENITGEGAEETTVINKKRNSSRRRKPVNKAKKDNSENKNDLVELIEPSDSSTNKVESESLSLESREEKTEDKKEDKKEDNKEGKPASRKRSYSRRKAKSPDTSENNGDNS